MSTTNPIGECGAKPALEAPEVGSQKSEVRSGDPRLGEVFDKLINAHRYVRAAMLKIEEAYVAHPWSPPSALGVFPALEELAGKLRDAADEVAEKQESEVPA
jgi:hypothetical protein